MRKVEHFLLQLGRSKEERLRGVGSCGIRETGCGYLTAVHLANVTSRLAKVAPAALGRTTNLTGKVGAFSPLAGIQQGS